MMNSKKDNGLIITAFIILMVGLGASDSMRGVFSPIFKEHFALSNTKLSQIVTVSYIGNLGFLMLGGRMVDKYKPKNAMIGLIAMWACGLLLFICTDSYMALLVGMFLAMGTSTMLNTTINIISSFVFISSPGIVVNFLYFTQGIGTSGSQSVVGNLATDINAWKVVNIILLAIAVVTIILLLFAKLPDHIGEKTGENEEKPSLKYILKQPASIMLGLVFGFYFIAEHGVLNWLVAYAANGAGLSMGRASNYLAVFFGGITVGRLVLSPLVDKLGVFKGIRYFGLMAAAMFLTGIVFGSRLMWLLSISGIFFSIIYPTLVMVITKIYPNNMAATASGIILSVASLFDIGFNLIFGKVIDIAGYKTGFLIIGISAVIFIALFWKLAFNYENKSVE